MLLTIIIFHHFPQLPKFLRQEKNLTAEMVTAVIVVTFTRYVLGPAKVLVQIYHLWCK